MCHIMPSWAINSTYVHVMECRKTHPHHILCSQCSYTLANQYIHPYSWILQSYIGVAWSWSFLDSTSTKNVGDMSIIPLQLCLDQDVMMVTVIYNDRMLIISWITLWGVTKRDGYRNQIVPWTLATEYIFCWLFLTITRGAANTDTESHIMY